jgi:toxin ParE1/3/4
MQLRWTEGAADDLERIADYLGVHAPERAGELVRALYEAPSDLLIFPNRGRAGKKEGTREFVLAPLPYIVVYQVRGEVIFVVRVLHGAQKWP